ncbi:hypothetical protein MMPV_006043 [Pyropia vietnamensis]
MEASAFRAAAVAVVALVAARGVAASDAGGGGRAPAAGASLLSDHMVVVLGVVAALLAIAVTSKILFAPAAVAPSVAPRTAAATAGAATPAAGGVISTDEYTAFPLTHKTETSHNTRLFRFGLPTPDATLGLPLGRHISVRAQVDGKEVKRPYTPTSGLSTTGHFELLIKVYPEPHGTMSRHLDSLQIGDTIDVRGPLGKFAYTRGMAGHVCMIAGGTGITPMWQVLTALIADPEDTTRLSLILANVTPDDILLKEQLDALAAAGGKNAFSVYYVLNKPAEGWTGGVGFVTTDHIRAHFGPVTDDALVLLCGPPPMNKAMLANLDTLGYGAAQIFKF